MLDWDTRTRALLGDQAMEKLQRSRVAVIGLGGVGSYAAEALVRCGVGNMLLVDPDRIEASNLNRQLPALQSTIGLYKVDVLQQRFRDIAPGVQVEVLRMVYNKANSHHILGESLDYVVDAIDSLPEKVHLMESCLNRNLAIVSAMGAANRLDPAAFRAADISETSICPMARVVRRQLRQRGIERGIKVVYSTEPPHSTMDPTKLGTVSFVPPAAGLLMASVVVRDLISTSGELDHEG
ncbi:MAG TPA: tRNA threonylcarbamoyladenosine dehydratase [Syntrophomonadaceae bacterium]|nr:tRNA threonylcarbamoyladenosine dehydratase [Syntrophomonadaceae bacterium]